MSADPIGDLVDWQLSQRRPIDVITSVCRVCRSQWTDSVTTCPECGVMQ